MTWHASQHLFDLSQHIFFLFYILLFVMFIRIFSPGTGYLQAGFWEKISEEVFLSLFLVEKSFFAPLFLRKMSLPQIYRVPGPGPSTGGTNILEPVSVLRIKEIQVGVSVRPIKSCAKILGILAGILVLKKVVQLPCLNVFFPVSFEKKP